MNGVKTWQLIWSILGVLHSTLSLVIRARLKPISLLISERKIRYVQNVLLKDSQTSELVKLLMAQELAQKSSPFYKDLARWVAPINQRPKTISSTSIALLKEQTIVNRSKGILLERAKMEQRICNSKGDKSKGE